MRLYFNKKTKKFCITNDSTNQFVKLDYKHQEFRTEVTLQELMACSFGGWVHKSLQPNTNELVLIPNKHGKEFKKFTTLFYNIQVAKRFLDGELPVFTEYGPYNHFLSKEKFYYVQKSEDFPIYVKEFNDKLVTIQIDDIVEDMRIFSKHTQNNIRQFIQGDINGRD